MSEFRPEDHDGEIIDQSRPRENAWYRLVGGLFGRRQQPSAQDVEGWMPAGLAESVLGVTAEYVDQCVANGWLRSRRMGDAVWVLREDVERLAKQRTVLLRQVQDDSSRTHVETEGGDPRRQPIVVQGKVGGGETIVESAVLKGSVRG